MLEDRTIEERFAEIDRIETSIATMASWALVLSSIACIALCSIAFEFLAK